MAKQGAVDKLVARIDADVAKAQEMHNFIVGNGGDKALVDKVEARIDEFTRMRDYITNDGDVNAPDKPKRTRKRKGLPTDPATT